eukprot:2772449-Pyramimonas_sp.AAC.1
MSKTVCVTWFDVSYFFNNPRDHSSGETLTMTLGCVIHYCQHPPVVMCDDRGLWRSPKEK